MQTAELVSTKEATDRLVKILDSTFSKAELEHVATNATQLNYEQITQLISLLKDFEGLFDDTPVYWYTQAFNLELNTNLKPCTCKYYHVSMIKKETFRKELKHVVGI